MSNIGQMKLGLTSSDMSDSVISNTWEIIKPHIKNRGYPQGGQFLTLLITLENSQGVAQKYQGFEFKFPIADRYGKPIGNTKQVGSSFVTSENTKIEFNKENYPDGVIKVIGQLYEWSPRWQHGGGFHGTTAVEGLPWSYPVSTTLRSETEIFTQSYEFFPEASAQEEIIIQPDPSISSGYRGNTLKYGKREPEITTEEIDPYVPPTEKPFEKPEIERVFRPEPEITTDHIEPLVEAEPEKLYKVYGQTLPLSESAVDYYESLGVAVTTSQVEPPGVEEPAVTTSQVDPPGVEEPEVTTSQVEPPGQEVTAQISWFGDTWFPWHLELEDRRRR